MVAISSERSPCPFGIPIVACMRCPFNFSNLPNWMHCCHDIWLRCALIFVTFLLGSCMHHDMLSKSHPRISFWVLQRPLPDLSFLMEMGLSNGSSFGPGGGNTTWMPYKIDLVLWSSLMVSACIIPKKSSMQTSRRLARDLHDILVSLGKFNSLGMLYLVSGCGSSSVSASHRSCVTSLAVSEAVQNSGGDLHQPHL